MIDATDLLVGSWHLKGYRRFRNGEFHLLTIGEGASGRIIYSANGYISAFLMAESWRRGQSLSPAWDTFMSYSGTWFLAPADKVHHHVDTSSILVLIGTTLCRHIEWISPNEIKLVTLGHQTSHGAHSHDELDWVRV